MALSHAIPYHERLRSDDAMTEFITMQPQAVSGAANATPRAGDIEQSVIEWLRAELGDPAIVGSDNFLDIGGHSLTFSKLNKFLADAFQVVLDMRTTYEYSISRAAAETVPCDDASGQ